MSREIDIEAPRVACVRLTLGLSQGAFAKRLGVARRTVIRGEQRGLELPPSWGDSMRDPKRNAYRAAWLTAAKEAEASPKYLDVADGDTVRGILGKVSQVIVGRYGQSTQADQFREHVRQIRDTLARAGVAPVTHSRRRQKPAKKRAKKLARRKR